MLTRPPAFAATTGFRWVVVALLFLATTINYVDRAVLGVLKPTLEQYLGWDQTDYGWMVTAFQAAYAAGYLLAGRWFDRIGVRLGLIFAVTVWSCAAAGHALATTVFGFIIARAVLGLAEGGFFPAAVKAVTEWFSRGERAFATGLFNSGSSVGAILCPVIVPWLADSFGWRGTFVVVGAIGLVWLVAWVWLYRSPASGPSGNAPEVVAEATSDPKLQIPWLELLRHRQAWVYVIGTMASAPVWWFYIFWAPDFLNKRYGLNMSQSSLPLMSIFLVAGGGGIIGGWLSSFLLRRGWTVNAARKTAMLVCALAAVPVFATPLMTDYRVAVALVALAAAAHSGYVANLFTIVSDTVPAQAVGSVIGLGGMAGSIAGMFFAQLVARVLHATNNNYFVPFAIAATAYGLALAVIHLLLPRLEPMIFKQSKTESV